MKRSLNLAAATFLVVIFAGLAFAQKTQNKNFVCHVLVPSEQRGYSKVVVTFKDITAVDKENALLKARARLQNAGTNVKAQEVLYQYGIDNVDFLCVENK